MSDNPLEDSPARDQRIRELAYQLWQADGSPHGSDLEYWERARELIAMEDSRGSGQLPVPKEDDPALITGQPIEEADIQDNLGEFPDRLSDQGEHPQTPSVRNLTA
jgi:hypothetical protein